MEFEKENDIMDQRQEMMDDAIDDVTGLEDEEESDEVVQKVFDELGVDLGQAVRLTMMFLRIISQATDTFTDGQHTRRTSEQCNR